MVRLGDLASRPDFRLGDVSVSPSRRRVEGPAGAVQVEPRTMQVFLILLDAAGKVVTRDTLFDQCWGGAMVGDDALNRAIGKVRRIADETAPGVFSIETIPRTGYRLTVDGISPDAGTEPGDDTVPSPPRFSRRTVVVGSLAGAGLAAGGIGLWSLRAREQRQFEDLIRRGQDALDYGDPAANPSQYLGRAVALRPNDARAHGLFAYARALRAESEPQGAGQALRDAQDSTLRALSLAPAEPNAQLAALTLQRSHLDLAGSEDRARQILSADRNNIGAMRYIWNLLQSAGRSRDALAMVERSLAAKPLAASCNFPRAQLLWILGRTAEADRVIDTAMQYWPEHRFVRFARFTIFAFTDRPRAALAMLDDSSKTPQAFSPAAVALWRVSLAAMEQRTPAAIAEARRANLEATKKEPRISSQAIQVMGELGEVDAAFEMANRLFLFQRPVEDRGPATPGQPPVTSTAWRFVPWLFTPPLAALRADPRFQSLCDGVGLTEYWAKRRVKPDYQLGFV